MSKSKIRDMDDIFGILNEKKTKLQIVFFFFKKKGENVKREKRGCRELGFDNFSERVSDFSLRSRAIRQSDFFGPRRKVVLRIEDNVWAPVSWSFDKLCEVGVLFYLSYNLFKCFVDI